MKIAVCMIAFDAADYIEYSLKSIYNFASQIIIVSGVDRFARQCGYSNVKTKKLIGSFPDPDEKLKFHKAGRVKTKIELRNKSLELVDSDVDWILIVDSDEVWTKNDLLNLKKRMKNTKQNALNIKHYFFFLDFYHKYHECTHPERAFRNIKGRGYFNWHTKTSYNDKKPLRDYEVVDDVAFYHYGYVGELGRINKKTRYSFLQLAYMGEKFKRFEKLNLPQGTIEREIKWRERHWFNDEHIEDVCEEVNLSEHPEVMKSHPYFGKSWREILFGCSFRHIA